ncbi:hypothetical protein [Sphingomonas sp. BK069]|uniref:hypothetical protein n=1 Tax=Sphingomonas sp. BK069 TaxID=2586979 RepID=UPI0016089F19|nr:hypothetical protein [Sphingomonas sp. BK069]MBB3347351.1 hypothetical protein [Sphingomonas sp. BK069]
MKQDLIRAARRQATAAGMKVLRRGDHFALKDRDTNSVVMGFGPDGRPIASIDEVVEWLGRE